VNVLIVVNASAAAPGVARRLASLLRARAPSAELARTATLDDLRRSIERLPASEPGRLIVAGGDGTVHCAVNALGARGRSRIELGILPSGTGNDFARSLRIPRRLEQALDVALGDRLRTIDLGECRCASPAGGIVTRLFANVAEAGLGGDVVIRARRLARLRARALAYQLAIAWAVARMRYARVEVRVDGASLGVGPSANVIVANGEYFGGGMRPFPWARLDDARLELGWMRATSRLEILRRAPTLRRGLPHDHPDVSFGAGRRVTVEGGPGPVPVEADGELLGELPAEFSILPAALRVACPAAPGPAS
jgi:diacylglycerol kinase (ATP)